MYRTDMTERQAAQYVAKQRASNNWQTRGRSNMWFNPAGDLVLIAIYHHLDVTFYVPGACVVALPDDVTAVQDLGVDVV